MGPALRPSLEYYGAWGPVRNLPLLRDPVHQILPGADLRIREGTHLELRGGLVQRSSQRLVVKSRFEFEFRRKSSGIADP